MGVYLCGNELKIDQESGDEASALLFATLLLDTATVSELQQEVLGCAVDAPDRNLNAQELWIAVDEVALIKRAAKHDPKPDGQYHIPVAGDMGPFEAVNLLDKVGLEPRDGNGLPYIPTGSAPAAVTSF